MSASLLSFQSLAFLVTAAELSDDTLPILFMLILLPLLAVSYWSFFSYHSKASRLSTPGAHRRSSPPHAPSIPPSVPAPSRRVIRLHSTTPGQAANEYNIGDNAGTRGSALERAA
jgi:hypothetical protein